MTTQPEDESTSPRFRDDFHGEYRRSPKTVIVVEIIAGWDFGGVRRGPPRVSPFPMNSPRDDEASWVIRRSPIIEEEGRSTS